MNNNINKVNKVIAKDKQKLIDIARRKGIYENFGQWEVRLLQNEFINTSSYSDEMNTIRHLIQNFDNWCMNYCGK